MNKHTAVPVFHLEQRDQCTNIDTSLSENNSMAPANCQVPEKLNIKIGVDGAAMGDGG
jgi:hypothetical protein